MRGVILVTDLDWYEFLSARPSLDEVNFWRPNDTRTPRQLDPGTPVLFKLRKRYGGWIVGYGVFAKHKVLPAWLAWDAFAEANGAPSFAEMRNRIESLRPAGLGPSPHGDYEIGCLMLSTPAWTQPGRVRPPSDWPENAVQGSSYDLSHGEGARVWAELLHRAERPDATEVAGPRVNEDAPRYGEEIRVRPRLGQGTFRISVLDAYDGACTVTGEHSLPALEAAHIQPFSELGPRDVTNGLLLRSDLHRLFDKGYVGVGPDYRFVVSDELRAKYSNGRSYYPLAGRPIELPMRDNEKPDRDLLSWHLRRVFRG